MSYFHHGISHRFHCRVPLQDERQSGAYDTGVVEYCVFCGEVSRTGGVGVMTD